MATTTKTQRNVLQLPKHNKASKLRHAKGLEEGKNGPKDLDEIRARRGRLERLTHAMKNNSQLPKRRSRSMAGSGSSSTANVRLTPIAKREPNELDRKRDSDYLLKKPKAKHVAPKSPTMENTRGEKEFVKMWEKERRMGTKDKTKDDRSDNYNKQREKDDYERHLQAKQRMKEEERMHEEEVKKLEEERKKIESKNKAKHKEPEDKEEEHTPTSDKSHTKKEVITERSVKEIVRQMKGVTEEDRLLGVYRARTHLSKENNPPIEMYIDAGAIPPLVACLSSYNQNLQFEAAWAITNITSGNEDQAMSVYEGGAVPELVNLLSSPYHRVADQCVWALGNLAGDGTFLWQAVVDEGAIKPLYTLIERSRSVTHLRNLSWTFSNILRHKPLNLSHSDFLLCVKAVRLFLHHPDKEIHLNACWSLVYVTDNESDKIEEVLKTGVLPRLIDDLLSKSDKNTVTPAIRVIGNILTGTDEQTEMVLSAGVLPVLIKHFEHSASSIRKDAIWAMSNITAGPENQIQQVIDAKALPHLINSIKKEDAAIRKESLWCVSNMTAGGSQEQIDTIIENGFIESFAKTVPKPSSEYNEQQLQVTLEGLYNMLKKSSHPKHIAEDILDHVSLEVLQSYTRNRDPNISKVAEKLCSKLSNPSEADDKNHHHN